MVEQDLILDKNDNVADILNNFFIHVVSNLNIPKYHGKSVNIDPIEDRSSHQRCSVKKMFLEILQNSQENTCARVSFFNKVAGRNFMEKETLAQVFSCEFGEISKNTFLTEHL